MNVPAASRTGRTVRDVMTIDPVTISVDTPFKEIVRLLTANRISAVPVLDAGGILVGIVSEADLILNQAFPESDAAPLLFVGPARRRRLAKAAGLVGADLMSSPVHTVSAAAGLGEAARLLYETGVKRLPVVDETGTLVGIVSRGDMLTAFLRPDAELVRDIREEVMVHTLWMDPTQIAVTAINGVVSLEGVVERRSDIPILTRLIRGVDGVVGIKTSLTYRFDDVHGIDFVTVGLPRGLR